MDSTQPQVLSHIPHFKEIEGWLLPEEAVELFERSINLASPHPIVCEIGSWKGRSSYVLASAMKEKDGKLCCIDPFNGDGDAASRDAYHAGIQKLGMPLLKNFENTMKRYGLWSSIVPYPMESKQARKVFKDSRIDLLFIDGNHEYSEVKRDYELWSPLIPSGGVIALHDVGASHVDGPRRVMEECIAGSSAWKDMRIVGEMGIAIKA